MSTAAPTGVSILLVADPGLPTRRAHAVKEGLQALLNDSYHPPIAVHVVTDTLRLRPDDTLDLSTAVGLSEEYEHPDAVLILTEIPRLTDGKPLIAEIFPTEQVAVVSCPTLGAFASRHRILHVLMSCTLRMKPTAEQRGSTGFDRRWTQWSEAEDLPGHLALHARPTTGGVRTVCGMVAGNEPLRTVPTLSSALAAASATAAFGIFYSSIWAMSTYLSTPRLLGIGVLAMSAMIAWLILSNGLWDRPLRASLARTVLLYNLSTILTMALCVAALYLALVLLILAGGLIVIAPAYMADIIGEHPSFTTYLDIAWLSAAMGVVAGALGSSFDQSTDLRRLTHGQRERQRRYSEG